VIRDRLDPPVTANQHFGADRRHGHLLREQQLDGGAEVEGRSRPSLDALGAAADDQAPVRIRTRLQVRGQEPLDHRCCNLEMYF